MDLELIKQYTHKIKKIHIINTNRYSLYDKVVLKINIPVKDNETVRFTLKENSDFIEHQQKNNDFFMRVPNNLVGVDGKPTITTIYAHFFDKELYQYKEGKQVFSEFDFSQLEEVATIQSSGYQLSVDKNKKTATVKSKLNNSIDNYKNPNYKHYTTSNISSERIVQGHLPTSSRYGFDGYHEAPSLLNQGPQRWTTLLNKELPYWEAHIHRDDLSPLISDGVENTNEDTPINVFLNYNYLPTSTDYHEHFYGFEDSLEYNQKYFNVFEAENIDVVSSNFVRNNYNNYRIVQLSNVYNDKYSMYISKGNIIFVDLDNVMTEHCGLNYNQCYGYYTYQPLGSPNRASKVIQLKKGSIYTLKYFIYIPDEMLDTEDVHIGVNDEKIHETFRKQDKLMREQWIYHEVPFISKGTDVIYIYGPMTVKENNICHFVNVTIEEMKEYSPTIKYNQKGIYLFEEDKYTSRPLTNDVDIDSDVSTELPSRWLEPQLPLIHKKVYFIFNRNKSIYYEQRQKNLYYMYDDEDDFRIQYNNYDLLITKDDDFKMYMNDGYDIIAEYNTNMIFTQSIGNHFSAMLKDLNGNNVYNGTVEAAIHDSKLDEDDDLTTALKYLGQREVKDSYVEFNGLDFSNLELENDEDTMYILHLKYVNQCGDVSFAYETIILQKTIITLTPMVRFNAINTNQTLTISENKQLPLQIQCEVSNQLGTLVTSGYVDLSIDDEEIQSTIVDTNGIADFYLDLDDLKYGMQTIKLEYFTKNYHPVKYIYFKVNNLIENKPTLPFIVKGIIQEEKTLPIDIEEYTIESRTITETQTYDYGFNPIFMNIDIDIPSGIMNDTLTLEIYRNNTLVKTYSMNYIPTDSIIFIDDVHDADTTDIVKYYTKGNQSQIVYTIKLLSNKDYRYNDVNITVTHQ